MQQQAFIVQEWLDADGVLARVYCGKAWPVSLLGIDLRTSWGTVFPSNSFAEGGAEWMAGTWRVTSSMRSDTEEAMRLLRGAVYRFATTPPEAVLHLLFGYVLLYGKHVQVTSKERGSKPVNVTVTACVLHAGGQAAEFLLKDDVAIGGVQICRLSFTCGEWWGSERGSSLPSVPIVIFGTAMS